MQKDEIDNSALKSLMTVEKDGFYVEIPPGILGRSMFEFLSPTTLIETFLWERDNTPKGQQAELVLLSYESEKEIWD